MVITKANKKILIDYLEAHGDGFEITGSYSGSGDSGSMDKTSIDDDHEVEEIVEDLVFAVTDADFDNQGSSGEFTIKLAGKKKLSLQYEHHHYYTESEVSEDTVQL